MRASPVGSFPSQTVDISDALFPSRIRLDLLPRLPAIEPLPVLEVEVAAVADLEHRHALGDVLRAYASQ